MYKKVRLSVEIVFELSKCHYVLTFSELLDVKVVQIITYFLKFMFSKKATKIDKIFTDDLTLCSKCQIDGEDFFNFFGLFRKHEL